MPVLTKVLVSALAFGAVNALPQPKARQAAPVDNTSLLADLITTPTHVKRYRKVLTDDSGKLLTGDALAKAATYDFNTNTIPVVGSNGGSAAAVSRSYYRDVICEY